MIVHLDTDTGTARLQGGPELPRSTAERPEPILDALLPTRITVAA